MIDCREADGRGVLVFSRTLTDAEIDEARDILTPPYDTDEGETMEGRGIIDLYSTGAYDNDAMLQPLVKVSARMTDIIESGSVEFENRYEGMLWRLILKDGKWVREIGHIEWSADQQHSGCGCITH